MVYDEENEKGESPRRDEHENGDGLETLPVHRLGPPNRLILSRHGHRIYA